MDKAFRVLAHARNEALVHTPDASDAEFAIVPAAAQSEWQSADTCASFELLRDPSGRADVALCWGPEGESLDCVGFFSDFDGGYDRAAFSSVARETTTLPMLDAAGLEPAQPSARACTASGMDRAVMISEPGAGHFLGLRRARSRYILTAASVAVGWRVAAPLRDGASAWEPLGFTLGEVYGPSAVRPGEYFAWAFRPGVDGSAYVRLRAADGRLFATWASEVRTAVAAAPGAEPRFASEDVTSDR